MRMGAAIQTFEDAFQRVRSSIVGLGFRTTTSYEIIGTGFFLDPAGKILTNRHVVERLLVSRQDGTLGVRPEAAAFIFRQRGPAETFVAETALHVTGIKAATAASLPSPSGQGHSPPMTCEAECHHVGPDPPDIGVCKISVDGAPPGVLPFQPLKLRDSAGLRVGTPVAFVGFPQGLPMPLNTPQREALQFMPLLQVGVVSGILPFPEVPKPDALVLDIYVNRGSSGSPLLLADGSVVGIVFATRLAFHELSIASETGEPAAVEGVGIFAPSALGLAVPTAQFPEEWPRLPPMEVPNTPL